MQTNDAHITHKTTFKRLVSNFARSHNLKDVFPKIADQALLVANVALTDERNMRRSKKTVQRKLTTSKNKRTQACKAIEEGFEKLAEALYDEAVSSNLLKEFAARDTQWEANQVAKSNIRQQQNALQAQMRAIQNGCLFLARFPYLLSSLFFV